MRYCRLFSLICLLLFGACNAQRNVLYLQNIPSGAELELSDNHTIRIKPLDQLTVVVNSKTPELAKPFNSSSSYNSLSGSLPTTTTGEQSLQVLTVDAQGHITMPILGVIECAGMTRKEFETTIERLIIDGGYITDPQVNVRFQDLSISVLGEVNRPGRYDINKDKITILEALSLAGDMTIYGNREDVAVVRERDGKSIVTKLDLRTPEIFYSPCYYLEQDDVVIVSPNRSKAATSEINQNRSFWISMASTAISLATLLITVLR